MPNFYESNEVRFADAFWRDKGWFRQFGDTIEVRDGDLLVHQDNGKKVLIVCHTDYITPQMSYSDAQYLYVINHPKEFPEDKVFKAPFIGERRHLRVEGDWVSEYAKKLDGPVVDDRLGCAVALSCSDWADILFTDCEEVGKSTAAFFTPPREYNWIVELDRKGTDVVTYQYQDKEWLAALGKHFTVGHGSFSDIGYMEKLGVSAVNVGIGYHNEHTRGARWDPKETSAQLTRLKGFLGEFGETQFSHRPAPVVNRRVNRHNHTPWKPVITEGGLEYLYIGQVRHFWSEATGTWEKCQSALGEGKFDDYYGFNDYDIESAISKDWLSDNYPELYELMLEIDQAEEEAKAGVYE